jgi:ribosomal protein S13
LIEVKGLGPSRIDKICTHLGISQKSLYGQLTNYHKNIFINFLTELQSIKEPTKLIDNISFSPIKRNLDNWNKSNIQRRLISNTYRGMRLRLRFPARGQRTRSNASSKSRVSSY